MTEEPPTDRRPDDSPSGDGGRNQDRGWGQPSWGGPGGYGQQPGYGPPGYGQPPYGPPPGYGQGPYGPGPYGYPPPPRYGNGMSITALVIGIVALVASPFPIGSYVAVLLAILALIFGIIALRRRVSRGMAMAGTILGGIALVVAIVASIIWTNVFRVVADCLDDYPSGRGDAFENCVENGGPG